MNKRWIVFLEFLIGGIFIGILEDFILIETLTRTPLTLPVLLTIFLVTLPFAFLGEYVVDKIDFLRLFHLDKRHRKKELFLEFLIFGVLIGVIEDLTAFYFSIGQAITSKVILTAFIIAIPFAFVSELLIDKIDFEKSLKKKKFIWKK